MEARLGIKIAAVEQDSYSESCHAAIASGGERVDAQDAPVSGQSYRYAYDGIGNRQISWLES